MSSLLFPRLTLFFLFAASALVAAPVSSQDPEGRAERIIAAPRPDDTSVHDVTAAPGSTVYLQAPEWPASWALWDYSADDGQTWTRIENSYFFDNAHGTRLTVRNISRPMDGLLFRVYLDGNTGPLQSEPGRLTVSQPAGVSRLANLSARSWVGPDAESLFLGYVMTGPGSKQLLVRGVGPTLTNFGLRAVLPEPHMTLADSRGAVLEDVAGWDNLQVYKDVALRVGAFALRDSSADSVLLRVLNAGLYTTRIFPDTTTGVALGEIYDTEPAQGPQLINLSARAYVGTGDNILIAGLVLGGDAPGTVLIRGIGPSLAKLGVPGVLARPQLLVVDSHTGKEVASGQAWDGSPLSARAFGSVGAFALEPGSQDCALILTLPPGPYTVQLSGQNGGTGVGLIEIYSMP